MFRCTFTVLHSNTMLLHAVDNDDDDNTENKHKTNHKQLNGRTEEAATNETHGTAKKEALSDNRKAFIFES